MLKKKNKIQIFVISFLAYFFLIFPSYAKSCKIAEILKGTQYTVSKGDSLHDIAYFYELGLDEVLQANPEIKNSQIIYPKQRIILPTAHLLPDGKQEGIIINLAEMRLYFFFEDDVESFPISIGTEQKTPIGKTKVIRKRAKPSWIPPESIRQENPELPEIIPPGPNNPLGEYALYLDSSKDYKWQNIVIHGTNAPWTIGTKASHGCIRMYPSDIEKLFEKVEIETPVNIVYQPLKVREVEERIFLESHLNKNPDLVLEQIKINDSICSKIKDCDDKVNWNKVDDAIIQNRGIPIDITKDF